MTNMADGGGGLTELLPSNLILEGQDVILEPMQLKHTKELITAAEDGELWKLEYTGVPDRLSMPAAVEQALAQKELGSEFPFIVRLKQSKLIVGSTRYYAIDDKNRNLSIGYTWYSKSVQRTSVNSECKYLLLEHAFERMKCISVQWHTDHRNVRSQNAIKRLGAKFEGVLRNAKIMPDGAIRHTHCFSMLDTEWPESKTALNSRLSHFRKS